MQQTTFGESHGGGQCTLHCETQHFVVLQYSTVLCSTALCSAVQHSVQYTLKYCTQQYITVLCSTAQSVIHTELLHIAVQHCVVQCTALYSFSTAIGSRFLYRTALICILKARRD